MAHDPERRRFVLSAAAAAADRRGAVAGRAGGRCRCEPSRRRECLARRPQRGRGRCAHVARRARLRALRAGAARALCAGTRTQCVHHPRACPRAGAGARSRRGAPRRGQAWAAIRPAHSGQGQRQHKRLPDLRGHSGAAHASAPKPMPRWSQRCGRRARSCSARPICTSSPTAGPATTSPSAPCEIPTITPAFPAAAAAEPRLQSPPVSLLSVSRRIRKDRFVYRRRSAASQGFGPRRDAIPLKAACRSLRCSIRWGRTRAASPISCCSTRS